MKVILTGGGTAGYVTPAIQIGKTLKHLFPEIELIYLGNERYIEKMLAERNGIPFQHITSKGLKGSTFKEKYIEFLNDNMKGVKQALGFLQKERVDFVIGTGGFTTFPVLYAARKMKIPYFLHEQNKRIGKVNKYFLKNCAEIYYSFDNTYGAERKKGKVFGNPVTITEPIEPGNDLVVLSGSGGSEFLNNWAITFAKENPEIKVHLQAGMRNIVNVKEKCEELSNVTVYGFTDIEKLLPKAKVVVSRSGISTLFELYYSRIPTITVPLPNSADDHQRINAEEFESFTRRIKKIEQNNEEELHSMVKEWMTEEILYRSLMRSRVEGKKLRNSAENIAKDIYNMYYDIKK